jgi:hypothetical protein
MEKKKDAKEQETAPIADQIDGMGNAISKMAGGKEVKFVDEKTGETTLTIPAAGAQNFLFELESFHHGKVHVVVAPDESEAARLLAEHCFAVKAEGGLKSHQEKCHEDKCDCKNYKSAWIATQIKIYQKRRVAKKFPVDEPPHVIGRNADPLPAKEQLN